MQMQKSHKLTFIESYQKSGLIKKMKCECIHCMSQIGVAKRNQTQILCNISIDLRSRVVDAK